MITKMKKEKYDAPVAEALEVKIEGYPKNVVGFLLDRHFAWK